MILPLETEHKAHPRLCAHPERAGEGRPGSGREPSDESRSFGESVLLTNAHSGAHCAGNPIQRSGS
jgi:hypothetical protein